VFGAGEFYIPATIDNDWSGGLIVIAGGGDAYFEVDRITIDQGVGVGVYQSGRLTLKGNFLDVTGSGYCVTARDESDTTFQFQRISTAAVGFPFLIRHGDSSTFTGTCVISSDEITTTAAYQPIGMQNVSVGASIIVTCPRIISNTSYCINISAQTGGTIVINGDLLTTGGGGGVFNGWASGGKFTLNGDIITTTGRAYISNSACTVNNEFKINGDILIESGRTEAIYLDTGKLRLNGSITNVDPGGTGTTFNGISLIGAGTLVIDTVKIITDNECIYASTPRTIKVIHSLASNVDLNTNVTNLIVATPVVIDTNIE
jgi:hypothetical protein